MKTEGSIKQEHILDVAVRRFSHFGIHKTTLTEIAEDLGISKPSLFYYFQDKHSLLVAVAGKIINEFLEGYRQAINASSTTEEALLSLIEVKRQYFKKYFLLAIQGDNVDPNKFSAGSSGIFLEARQQGASLIEEVISKGISRGELRPVDTMKTSSLLLETLAAFEYCIRMKKSVPDMKDIDDLFDKQKEVLAMIVNGLKINSWKP